MDTYKNYSHLNMANQKRGKKNLSPKDSSFLSLLLFWILPFIVVNALLFYIFTATPKIEISIEDPGDFTTAVVNVKVASFFPNDGLNVTFAEVPLEMEKIDSKTYRATVNANGTVRAEMTNKNGMTKTEYEAVDCIDDAPPTIQEADSATGFVSMYVDDPQSGVNFGSIYAVLPDGSTIGPSLLDEGESLVVFNYDAPSIEVHVTDNLGKEAVVVFGGDETVSEDANNLEAIE